MARRLVHKTRVGRCAVLIYRDAEWNEYVVKTVIGGRSTGTYHTGDKDDAQGTATHIARRLRAQRRCT